MKRFLLAATLAIAPATVQAGPLDIFSDIFVFGDSLSDPGNLFNALIGAPVSPDPRLYPNGQITDGDAWATQIGADFASGRNFAFGSAQAAPNGPINFDVPDLTTDDLFDLVEVAYDVPDFADQIAAFQTARTDGLLSLGANPLAAVWFGGNDLLDGLVAPDPAAALPESIGNAVTSIVAGVAELFKEGFSKVAVFSAPNLGRIPEVLARGPEAVQAAINASIAFNTALFDSLSDLPNKDDIAQVDIFGLFEEVVVPGAGPFSETTEPCLPSLLIGAVPDCSGYLFYDDIHPTEAAHALIAERFTETVAPVPLPASVGFLLAGLGGLLVLRRRSGAA